MAVTMVRSEGNRKFFQGLATDVRPEDDTSGEVWYRIGSGSEFYCVDTKATFIYDQANLNVNTYWWAK